jgi:hypothetical protein
MFKEERHVPHFFAGAAFFVSALNSSRPAARQLDCAAFIHGGKQGFLSLSIALSIAQNEC